MDGVRFDEDGLVVCVAQDRVAGDVLMVAYMNEEALTRTIQTGELHLYSRSRGELWRKGETSGHLQAVRQLRYDCDGDAVLALVDPAGPACHTGERSCFYRSVGGSADTAADAPGVEGEPVPVAYEALGLLERTLRARAEQRPEGSYTVELLEDPERL
ncbi:MAG: phosphoribosyl-AMP cyclohydrolase, partial [Solirubrobacterales bacterium]